MTCECCHFDQVVKALSTLVSTVSVSQKDDSSSRRQVSNKELDLVAMKILRESSKKRPKQQVLKPLKKFHPKFLQLVKFAKELVLSPDGTTPSLPQQICLACSATSNDDNLSNSGQTFVSIDAMTSAGIASSNDPAASVSLDEQDDPPSPIQDSDPSQDSDPASSDTTDPSLSQDPSQDNVLQTSHDYLSQHALVEPVDPNHPDPQPTSNLPPHIHDLLVKYLNDFRSLSTFEQILILQQWAGGTFSDFGSMKWLPDEFKRPQSKQLISQRWAKTVQKFPLAAVLQNSRFLRPLSSSTNSLAQHYANDNTVQPELPLLMPKPSAP